jgi:hypothetical protein
MMTHPVVTPVHELLSRFASPPAPRNPPLIIFLIWLALATFVPVQAAGAAFPRHTGRRGLQDALALGLIPRLHRKNLRQPSDHIASVFGRDCRDEMRPRCREIQIGAGRPHSERIQREIGGVALKEIVDIRSPTQKNGAQDSGSARFQDGRWRKPKRACFPNCRQILPPRIPPSHAREETPESRGMPCPFLNTERGFGGKPPKKSGFRRHLAGSKMPKETFFTAMSRWRVVSRRALDASGFW